MTPTHEPIDETRIGNPTDPRNDFAARALRTLPVPESLRARLLGPTHVQRFTVPVERDDGDVDLFPGYRVRHDDARGPFLGPHCYRPELDAGTCAGLAAAGTWTAAVAGVPFGGAAGGVAVDPTALSRGERNRLGAAYAERVADSVGPDTDVLAPGVGADARAMAGLADALREHAGTPRRTVVGKPAVVGGLREPIAGRGLTLAAQEALDGMGRSLPGADVAVYGCDGPTIPARFDAYGTTVVAVRDRHGAAVAPSGLEPDPPSAGLRGPTPAAYDGTDASPEGVLGSEADLLVVAGGETLSARAAERVAADVVIEGTYRGLTPAAEQTLEERGIEVVPDVLATVGGLIAARLEWGRNGRDPDPARVDREVGHAVVGAFDEVRRRREADGCGRREAAYALAVSRTVAAHEVAR
ncbi:Glu/Leu/Phe/Val family dehydrogenase [Saliphagus infecundisoli]|uniref:Glutamate dehydrogenase n=2 Tax=Saliphagus TaxID=2039236 RepID=A0ABD5QMX7_9EURY|nr:Glu/Leu/Phe/Val dehydrogenase dimerization domain-containing protein [Saliphagus infecundisoli]